MGKESKKTVEEVEESHNPLNFAPIAHPLAPSKLTKKIFKTIKKASKDKHAKRGVKEVAKAIRKGETGIVVLAADISPVDVISHLPIICEEAGIPYCYVPSKQALGESGLSKRPTSVVMLADSKKKGTDYEEGFDSVKSAMGSLTVPPSVLAK